MRSARIQLTRTPDAWFFDEFPTMDGLPVVHCRLWALLFHPRAAHWASNFHSVVYVFARKGVHHDLWFPAVDDLPSPLDVRCCSVDNCTMLELWL